MAKTFTDTASLLAAINKDMMKAMEETSKKGLQKAKKNANDFYSQGSPVEYDRTGKYGNAPKTDGVMGGGNHWSTEIYMSPDGNGYTTGSFSAQQVWQAAEDHTAGVLGKSGRWAQTEVDVEEIANNAFAKRFN